MNIIEIEGFLTFTLAIMLLFVGKWATARFSVLRKYSIPEPVIGGFVCAAAVALLYYLANIQLQFDLELRDYLLLYFFAAIGLKADFKTLISGGKPLLVLTVLAVIYIVLQNGVGLSLAAMFGMDPIVGLLSGSISLIGGVGTTMAWAPTFQEMGIEGAAELGIASNTVGLIAACLIGGPIAKYLINRHQLKAVEGDELDIGVHHEQSVQLDHFGYLYAWLFLNICIIIGYVLNLGLQEAGLNVPMFVSCLIAGILVGNFKSLVLKKEMDENASKGLSLISDICLGMFLTMALMGLQLWQLVSSIGFIGAVMFAQLVLSVAFTVFIVFRLMGKDYEAAVISSGFGGITLGSTATAIVNMTAVTQQHGSAHKAFIIVPLVCGFFIDIANALIINSLIGLFS
ncbi:sodium/glutamate symporter [Paraferrimonas sedimenticola]|uniref:Sodium/glutamate symporter n=1 Tax=Paraferrimonas sedimenticola TaxID=375674 RepID=A0AA37RWB7_9GAMM|nr:sodium/glutamate symporter [Paraferrimonas sedimenticola]GLP96391.1 sodium/glutamate symporter [Paraferrimonas sedimenticola]